MARRAEAASYGRGSAGGWLAAAYETLVEGGVDRVKVVPLAAKLKLSRTSFYWFYDNREALLAALIGGWRVRNTGNLIAQSELHADSITEAILNVFDCWLDSDLFDSRLEFAVRSWAQQSSSVSGELEAADTARLEALRRMFVRFGYEPRPADVRSRAIYLTQIGYISMKTHEDLATRMRRIGSYVEIFTGKPAQVQELNRFFSRHRYDPKKTESPVASRIRKRMRTP